jgi:hypothetical protein
MNKKANKKAFFILLCIGLMYLSMAFNVTEKFSMKRTLNAHTAATPAGFSGTLPERVTAAGRPAHWKADAVIEPALFVSIPIVLLAIQGGLIEKEDLILIKKENNAKADFKKPLEILKDRDEEGLTSIAEFIGKKQLLHLLKKEGILVQDDHGLSDIILGKGYTIEERTLLSLFDKYVTDEYNGLFPFVCNNMEMTKNAKGFEMTESRERGRIQAQTGDAEWVMPNLANLPIKEALERLTLKTSRVKIYGSGVVTDQSPKSFEKVKGEAQCIIYGRSYKQ